MGDRLWDKETERGFFFFYLEPIAHCLFIKEET